MFKVVPILPVKCEFVDMTSLESETGMFWYEVGPRPLLAETRPGCKPTTKNGEF